MTEIELSRGERTRAAIIEAAYGLFQENGYHATSMRQIALGARVALGGIYNHFCSKEEVFLAVLMRYHPYERVVPAMNSAQGATVEEFVRDAAVRMVGSLDNRLEYLNLLFIELVEFKGVHFPKIFEVIFPQVLEFAQRFIQGREEIRPIPTPIITRAFVGLFFSYTLTELLISAQFPTEMKEHALDYFVDIFLHGILKEKGASTG